MALFHINYPSTVMNKFMAMNVLIPDEDRGFYDSNGKYPVLYLLHGYTDDYTKWMRLTSIERYAMELGFAVVMPDGGKSFYTDMAHGDPYFTHLTEEVPEMLKKWFPITDDPKYSYLAGLSMGGYGAMKIGMTYPERFGVVGSFSGALAVAQTAGDHMPDEAEDWLKRLEFDFKQVFDDVNGLVGGPHDVFWLAGQFAASSKDKPELYLSCGKDDFILGATVAFADTLKNLDVPYEYHISEGEHQWDVWDSEVYRFMKWILEIRS